MKVNIPILSMRLKELQAEAFIDDFVVDSITGNLYRVDSKIILYYHLYGETYHKPLRMNEIDITSSIYENEGERYHLYISSRNTQQIDYDFSANLVDTIKYFLGQLFDEQQTKELSLLNFDYYQTSLGMTLKIFEENLTGERLIQLFEEHRINDSH